MTGNKYQREVDMPALPGVLGLEIVRHYNSVFSRPHHSNGILGRGWKLSYETDLYANGKTIQIVQADGKRIIFDRDLNDPSHCTTANHSDGSVRIVKTARGAEYIWTWENGRRLSFNTRGKLVQIAVPSGEFVSMQHDSSGLLLSVTDPQHRSLHLRYLDRKEQQSGDRFRGVQRIDSPVGQFTYSYGSALPRGATLDRMHVLANLVKVGLPGGTVSRIYHYDDARHPTLMTGISVDSRGGDSARRQRLATYGYDADGRAVLTVRGEPARLQRGADGRPLVPARLVAGTGVEQVTLDTSVAGRTVVSNSLGQETVFLHTILAGEFRLLEVRGAGCAGCGETNVRYGYDTLGRLVQTIQLGTSGEPVRAVTNELDSFGRVVKVSQTSYERGKPGPSQWLGRYAYPASGAATPTLVARPSVVPGRELVTRIDYNDRGQMLKISEQGWTPALTPGKEPVQIERGTQYRYSMINNRSVLTQVSNVGPTVDSTEIRYDRLGNYPNEVLAPGNQSVRIVRRDEAGRPLNIVVPGGLELAFQLDSMGRVTKLIKAGGSESFKYNALGQLEGIVQPNGQSISYAYGADGRLTSMVDAQGNRIRIERDTEGRLTRRALLNPDGSVAMQTEVEAGTLDPQAPGGGMSGLADGRPTAALATDVSSNVIVGPDEAIRKISYDRRGQLTQLTDPRRLSSTHEHDDFGRLVKVSSPDGGIHVFTYDGADRVLSKTSAYGTPQAQTITYRYDAAGRVAEQIAPEGKTTIAYGSVGRPVRVVFPGGEERYGYDAAGRLTEHTRIMDGQSFTTRYAFDKGGQLKQKTLPDGQVLSYRYHGALHPKAGLLASITREDLFGKTALLQGLNDAEDGYARQRYQLAHGLDYVREADQRGQISRIGSAGVWEEQHQFDWSGRVVRRDPMGTVGDRTAAYAYDPMGRLTGLAHGAANAQGYGYDANGNLLAQTVGDRLTRYTVDPFSNRIVSAQSGGVVRPYAYNGAGSVTQVGSTRYSWDSHERLVKVSDASSTVAEYVYNPFGERIKKVSYSNQQKTVTYYLYDGSELVAEAEVADGAARVTRQYVWLSDQGGTRPIAMLQARPGGVQGLVGGALAAIPTEMTRAGGQATRTDVFAIVADHTGAPRAMVNDRKQVVWRAEVTGFGRANVAANATMTLNLRGSNQYFDAESELHYNTRRYLDPATGRYLSADPSGLAGGENLYAFADNDPIGKVDPMGLRANPAGPVSGWSVQDRVGYVLGRVADKYPGELGDALKAMISPEALGTTAAIFAIWQVAQFTPYGWAANVAIAGIGYLFAGKAIWDVISGIYDASSLILDAQCEKELKDAGDILAKGFGAAVAAATGASATTGASKIAKLVNLLFKDSAAAKNAATAAAITQKFFGQFVPGRSTTGAAANAAIIARRGPDQYPPWKAATTVLETWLNPGKKIYMINETTWTSPGGWATPKQFSSLAEARKELSLLKEFKGAGPNPCCVITEYTVIAPIPVRVGTAGPLTSRKVPTESYPGGATQYELLLDRSLPWTNFLKETGNVMIL